MNTRQGAILLIIAVAAIAQTPKRTGVKAADVRIPMTALKPDTVYAVPGAPDWMAVDESAAWVSNSPKNSVSRLDARSDRVETIAVGTKPCSGLAIGFGSVWVPNCGDRTMSRIDAKSGKATATFETGIADSEGGIAAGADSIWLMSDRKGTLVRIDPETNKPVTEIHITPGSFAVAFGEGAVWATSTEHDLVTRVDPRTNLVVETIPVGKQPRFLTVGEGGVWALNQGDGTVSRIDPKTNKVAATIEVGVPGPGGEISAGEGSVWVTAFGFPISRIDPLTNKVVQQFVGEGGDSIRAGGGWLWLTDLKKGTVWRIDPKRIAATVAGR